MKIKLLKIKLLRIKSLRIKSLRLIILLTPILFLSGCYDSTELENRGFVISLGIDKTKNDKEMISLSGEETTEDGFILTMATPDLNSVIENKSDEKSKLIKQAENKSLTLAIDLVNSMSSQKMYYGQTKICVFGKDILENEKLFKEALDALIRNKEISRKINILATKKDAADILKAEVPGEPMVGLFIADLYKNKSESFAITKKLDIEEILKSLYENGTAIIPQIEYEDKKIKLGGAAFIKDYTLAGWLDDIEIQSYLLSLGDGDGAVVNAQYNDMTVPLKVLSNNSQIKFYEKKESSELSRLNCSFEIDIIGKIEEFTLNQNLSDEDTLQEIKDIFKSEIENRIIKIINLFQKEYEADGFLLSQIFYKFYPELSFKYYFNEEFKHINFDVDVDIKIENIGSVK